MVRLQDIGLTNPSVGHAVFNKSHTILDGGIIWWSGGQDSALSLPRTRVLSLVGELRSPKPAAQPKKKKILDGINAFQYTYFYFSPNSDSDTQSRKMAKMMPLKCEVIGKKALKIYLVTNCTVGGGQSHLSNQCLSQKLQKFKWNYLAFSQYLFSSPYFLSKIIQMSASPF